MGVEYKHFIIPTDPTFVPKNDAIIKIDNLLEKWNLKTGTPKVYNLTNGENALVEQPINSIEFENGIAIEYPEIIGKIVKEIIGSSYYKEEISDDDRYIQNINFIVGSDYRIHPSNDELDVFLLKPPHDESGPIEPYCEYDDLLYGLHAEAYNCSNSCIAPKVDVSSRFKNRVIGEQPFQGFWRTALIIDCGKDLPNLGENLFKLANNQFISDIEEALGTSVIQIGEVY